jgi:hypothetical protein
MLKITQTTTVHAQPLLRLEGRLIGPWVEELRAAFESAVEDGWPVHVDFSAVHYVDRPGLRLVCDLRTRGAVLHAVSHFVEQLLHEVLP